MKLQKAVVQETLRIAVGTLALAVLMNGAFVVLGQWNITVLWGTLLGCFAAVLNFFLLGITVQKMAADGNEKRGKLKLQLSYSLRMLAMLGVVVLGIKLSCFSWMAVVLPLVFPRITIALMQLFGLYRPESKSQKGGDDAA